MLVAAFVIPTPFGQNALRLPVLLGPALLVLAPRTGAPRAAIAAVLVALLYLQWLPAVRAVAEAHGDPSTRGVFFADPRAFLEGVVQPGERVEVAFTHNHWEAAHLASVVPLARGWERQLDEKANPLFYDDRPLTPERYHRWLRDSGGALGRAPRRAAGLLGQGRGAAARAAASRTCGSSTARPGGASGRCATPRRPPPAARASRPRSRTASTSTPAGRRWSASATRAGGGRTAPA